jgi:rhodanese-related sulfurtransferase
MLDWALPTLLDEEMGALVSRHLGDQGVRLILSQRARRFEGTQGGRVRKLATDSETLDCDIALVSIGVRPEVSLAVHAGLEIGPTHAIAVNEHLQTSDPAIYAGGDCVECRHLVSGKHVFVPLGSTANKHGRVIGTNVAGGRDTFPGIVGTAIAKVFDITVGRTGLTEKEARGAGCEIVSSIVSPVDISHYYPGGKRVTLKVLADARNGRVLGAQCVGSGEVAKRIDVIATAITCGADVTRLTDLDLAYAPPYSPAMDAVHNAANVIRNKMDGTAKGISAQELKSKMDGHSDLLILDVRTDREWKLSRIEHPSVRHIPIGKLASTGVEFCSGKEVVTLCHSSVRAYQAQKLLERRGCSNVKFLDGSLSAWPYEIKE